MQGTRTGLPVAQRPKAAEAFWNTARLVVTEDLTCFSSFADGLLVAQTIQY